jgi:ATP-dependent Lon protease
MVKRDFREIEEVPGFTRYRNDSGSRGILLPNAVAADISAAAETAAAEVKALSAKAKALAAPPVRGGKPLPKIRIDTDLADATAFAKKLLRNVAPPVLLSAQLSQDLLVAVLMLTACTKPEHGMDDVLYYVVDPAWDCPRQISYDLRTTDRPLSPSAKNWLAGFAVRLDAHGNDDRTLTDLFQAANRHWSSALSKPITPARSMEKPLAPSRVVEVFGPAALEQAALTIANMSQERRGVGVRLLEQARANQGNRTLPNSDQACENLEAKKLNFENLMAPIERLQECLRLAGSMDAREFRMSPILLLGSPGIGKTYLAHQLADALGVPSEKISAGGAQGGFQLTGSHGAWMSAKPGIVAALLAKSASASPVLVIDEVDKIADLKYPVLPVLLDLLDAGTAKEFRDEYLEMGLDASRIIFILTANDRSQVPSPLLSRVEEFTILPPEPAQRLRIIEQAMVQLRQKTNQQIRLGSGVAERLAERMDIDLRQLNRLVSSAFAKALQAGDKVARIPTSVALDLAAWLPVLRAC